MANKRNGSYCFIWKIENFSMCPLKVGESLKSPQFISKNINQSHWHLSLFPKGVNEEAMDYISIYINRCEDDTRQDVNDNIDLHIDFLEPNHGDTLVSSLKQNLLMKKGDTEGWDRFFKRKLYHLYTDSKEADLMERFEEDTLTIRCTLFNLKQEDCEVRTKIGIDRCFLKRNMTYQNLESHNGEEITLFGKIKVKMTMGTAYDEVEDDDFVTVLFDIIEELPVARQLSCKISLLDSTETELVSNWHTRFFEGVDSWPFPCFIKTDNFKDYINDFEKEFNNNTYTFHFEFSTSNGNCFNALISPDCKNLQKINDVIQLQESLQDMYDNKLYSDVEICVDEKIFHAHKSVLAARSPVFLAMFKRNFYESRTNKVIIPDVSSRIFELFLQYMYIAKIDELDFETVCKLLVVADKYQVLTLKSRCADILKSSMSEENVCEMLTLADMFSYQDIRMFALDYIANHAKEIFTSSKWKNWSEKNMKLASGIMSHIAINFEIGPKKNDVDPCFITDFLLHPNG